MSTLDLDLVPVPDLLLLTYTRKGSTLLPAYCVTCRCPCYSRPPRLNWGRCSRHPATPPKYCDNRWLLPHSRGAVDTHPAHKQAHTHTRAHTRCMHAAACSHGHTHADVHVTPAPPALPTRGGTRRPAKAPKYCDNRWLLPPLPWCSRHASGAQQTHACTHVHNSTHMITTRMHTCAY